MKAFLYTLRLLSITLTQNITLHLKVFAIFTVIFFLEKSIIISHTNYIIFGIGIVKGIFFISSQIYLGKLILNSINIEQYALSVKEITLKKYLLENIKISLFLLVLFIFILSMITFLSLFMKLLSSIIFITLIYLSPIFLGQIFRVKNWKDIPSKLIDVFRYKNLNIAFSTKYIFLVILSLLGSFLLFSILHKIFGEMNSVVIALYSLIENYIIGIYFFAIVSSMSIFLIDADEENKEKDEKEIEKSSKLRIWLFWGQLSLAIPVFLYISMGSKSNWEFTGTTASAYGLIYAMTIFIPNVIFVFISFGKIVTNILNPNSRLKIFDFIGIGLYTFLLLFLMAIQFAPNYLNFTLKSQFSNPSSYTNMTLKNSQQKVLANIKEKYHDENISHYSSVYADAYNSFLEAKTDEDILEADIKKEMAIDCLHYFFNKKGEEEFLEKAWAIRKQINTALENSMQRTINAKQKVRAMGQHFYDYNSNEINRIEEKVTNFWKPQEDSICTQRVSADELYKRYQILPFEEKLFISSIVYNDKNSVYVASGERGVEYWTKKDDIYEYNSTVIQYKKNENRSDFTSYTFKKIYKKGSYIIATQFNRILFYKIVDATTLVKINEYRIRFEPKKIEFFDNNNKIFISQGSVESVILDVSNMSDIHLIKKSKIHSSSFTYLEDQNITYVVKRNRVDIHNFFDDHQMSYFEYGDNYVFNEIALSNDKKLLFLTVSKFDIETRIYSGTYIFKLDLTNPTKPKLIQSKKIVKFFNAIKIYNNLIFVHNKNNINIYDLNIKLVKSMKFKKIVDFYMHGNSIYISSGENGVEVKNILN